ncbi:Hypothetical predicted protein [Octopus vulgaris]|uniref:Uncharacterized protein n=1 Tax=Octopus vulgaris TaxID=6645 RepID=A0AA36BF46_OCTVU|nr:Hypothetical predicted protein [Octopus vulgaris]
MATPVAVQMNLYPIMNWDSSDVVEEFKKFKQKAQLAFKSFLKGRTDDEKKETRAKLAATQEQAQRHCNKHAQHLPEMLGGQHVHTQDPITKTWIPAKVVSRAETPRSNMIETESDVILVEKLQERNNDHTITPRNIARKTSKQTPTTTTTATTVPSHLNE